VDGLDDDLSVAKDEGVRAVRNGKPVRLGSPLQERTAFRDQARHEVELRTRKLVSQPAGGIPDAFVPADHAGTAILRVVWADYSGGPTKAGKYARYAWGSGVLLVLLGFAIVMARRDAPGASRPR